MTTKASAKKTSDPNSVGPFWFKWKKPDGSVIVTRYMYDPETPIMKRHLPGFSRRKYIAYCRESGQSVGYVFKGLYYPKKKTEGQNADTV